MHQVIAGNRTASVAGDIGNGHEPGCFEDDVGGRCKGVDGAPGQGVRTEIGIGRCDRAEEEEIGVVLTCAVDVVNDRQRRRIEQQRSGCARRRSDIDRAAHDQGVFAGDFDQTAVAAGLAARRRDMPVETGRIIGPYDDLAAVAVAGRICIDTRRAADEGRLGIRDVGIPATEIAADQDFAAAGTARRIDRRIVLECDLLAEHRDLSAAAARAADDRNLAACAERGRPRGLQPHRTARALRCIRADVPGVDDRRPVHTDPAAVVRSARRRGIDLPGIQHGCRRSHADEHDLSTLALDASGPDQSTVVDGIAEHPFGRARRDQHIAAIGNDVTAVRDLIVDRMGVLEDRLVDGEAQQTIAVEIDRDSFAGGEMDTPCSRDDDAFVRDARADQGDIAGIGIDPTLVDDPATSSLEGIQCVVAAHEIVDTDAHRAGDEAADIDLCARLEEHTVRIHQHDLAVGFDLTEDLAGFLIENTIQRRRLGVRLLEADLFVLADVERLPVERRALTALSDGGDRLRCVLADRRGAGLDLTARRSGFDGRRQQADDQARNECEAHARHHGLETKPWRWSALVAASLALVHASHPQGGCAARAAIPAIVVGEQSGSVRRFTFTQPLTSWYNVHHGDRNARSPACCMTARAAAGLARITRHYALRRRS